MCSIRNVALIVGQISLIEIVLRELGEDLLIANSHKFINGENS